MILPLGVFGITSVKITRSGTAILLMLAATCCRIARVISAEPDWPTLSVMNAAGTVPLISSGMPTTATSATPGHAMIALSISIVLSRCPATLMMSSTRPVTQKCPSASRMAASLVK